MTDESVTQWIQQLKAGDEQAARRLADRYYNRLVTLARRQLGRVPRRVSDEDDVAQSVLYRLCAGADQGRFPRLTDRNDLWALLLSITRGKVADHVRRETRLKRGGGEVRGESVWEQGGDAEATAGQAIDRELTPEFLVQMQEEHERLMNLLTDPAQRQIAEWRLEGCRNEEIAQRLGVSIKTVERKLRFIRERWKGELQ